MSAPTTTPELLDLVYQSGLTNETQLRAYVGGLTETQSLPSGPSRFAGELVRDGFLTVFQAGELVQGKWKGFSLGRYLMLEKIGLGRSCAFYLCEDTQVQRVAAIKLLAPALAEVPDSLGRLYREARAMAACSHPNVVCAYHVDEAEGLHYLAMEYIDGANLLGLVRRGPLDPVRAAHYVSQAAAGLQHVHEQGLVHRNVKPGKLLLDRSGTVKLGGMSIVLFTGDAQHSEESLRGTPNYIAPEQAANSSGMNHRADIYSLGCTAYHLLTGRVPFPEGTAAEKIAWQRTREPQPIRELRPEVPEEMARVVERMMNKTPDARYQSAAEVAAALAPWCRTPIPPPATEELPDHCPRVREAIARSSAARPGTP
jgi:serine/threonine protein kinase